MNAQNLQQLLFLQIKQKIPEQTVIAETIGKLLGISTDSAYRRMRGETLIDLDEAGKLCGQFNISMDGLLGNMDGKIIFSTTQIDENNFDFNGYMQGILRNMQYFRSFDNAKLYWECKDIPIFYHFHSRELAAFKYFFWMKYILQQDSFQGRRFSLEEYPDNYYHMGRRILHLYNTIPSVEFWNTESINSMLNQIRYFYETGNITKKSEVKLIFEKLMELFVYYEDVAESGFKVPLAEIDPDAKGESMDVFFNEVLMGNNMIVAKLGASQLTFFNHSGIRYTGTSDLAFGNEIMKGVERLTKSSTRLSSINEVERNAFFSEIRDTIKGQISRL
jgi:BetR domain